jgi:uncharacterized protein (TIGR00369 family)
MFHFGGEICEPAIVTPRRQQTDGRWVPGKRPIGKRVDHKDRNCHKSPPRYERPCVPPATGRQFSQKHRSRTPLLETMLPGKTHTMSQGSNDLAGDPPPAEMPRRPLPRAAVAELVGFTITDAKEGRAQITFQAGPQHANPMGTLHGGILCDVADAAMGYAFASTLAEGETFTTMDLRINFLRPVWNAMLHAEAKVVHRGRTVGYVECDITDEKNRVIAKSSSTCMVLRDEKATGRSLGSPTAASPSSAP